jgi:hypothetical protein
VQEGQVNFRTRANGKVFVSVVMDEGAAS